MGKHANFTLYDKLARQAQPEQDEENSGVALWDDDAWGNRNEADTHQKRIVAEVEYFSREPA